MKPPRSIFRARRKRPPAYLAPLTAALERHRERFKPGTVTEVRTWHAARCPYPRGRGECSCKPEEIEVEVVDPLKN